MNEYFIILFDQTSCGVESSAAEAPSVKDVDYHAIRISIKNCLHLKYLAYDSNLLQNFGQ